MATTYFLLEKKELASDTSSFTFSNIPNTYTDLRLFISGKTTYTGDTRGGMWITFNGVNSNYYSHSVFAFDGANATAQSASTGPFANINSNSSTANTSASLFGYHEMVINNYSDSNSKSIFLSFMSPNSASNYVKGFDVLSSSVSAPIYSITIGAQYNNLKANSMFSLYGIKRN